MGGKGILYNPYSKVKLKGNSHAFDQENSLSASKGIPTTESF